MSPKLLILFCTAAIWVSVADCETKISDDGQRARLPEFLTELDLASVEASEEDIDSLRKVVKRLAPAKNGEYQVYQAVMGQPGVDFPVLTSIPSTKFSCRGVKGGYYADLETNCQVFHICENGRKVSFLCPNGTVFQQSQLICDWWFKVDCGKSAELYEQSAEQLAEDDRKRAEAKKMNSEFHRNTETNNGQVFFQNQNQNQNSEYDGRQNGRTNPFGQSAPEIQSQNQNQSEEQQTSQRVEKENVQTNQQQNGRNGNQFSGSQSPRGGGQYNQNYYNQQSENGQQTSRQNYNSYNARNGNQNSNHRSPKAFESRNNYNELTTTASPFKEYQQPAESAAFATSRNNRYNKSYQYNQFGGYYSGNQISTTEKYESDAQSAFGKTPKKEGLPFPTFTPIYKPRTSTVPPQSEVTTQKSYVNTDIYRHNTATETQSVNFETVTGNPYQTTTARYQGDNHRQNSEDARQPSTQKPYVNTDTYRPSGGFTTVTDTPTTSSSFDQTATPRPYQDGYVTLTTANYEGNTVTDVTPNLVDIQSLESTQNPVTGRNLSPYDTSITYKYGKISSTLGPYVPFTRNYAYTTTTTTSTAKPPVYTATVPTIPDYRKLGSATTETSPEREHAMGMLHSLQELEATAPTADGSKNGSRIGLEIPPSSGPATLHTLALYFATASDNFDSNESSTDTAVRVDAPTEPESLPTTEDPSSAELPTSLLTQNTINSYVGLFHGNSEAEGRDNSTSTRLAEESDEEEEENDDDNDLDLQQSQGPVSGDNQRNGNPKLRQLAQVFTHALSAYLQDPETFRKVLTEIRPTEPPSTVGPDYAETTTLYPTTQEDYPSATKEKDEVLDFSDVTKASRRKKLTTPYPTTSQTFTTPSETTYQAYTTPEFIDESLNEAQSSDFRSSENDFASEVNHAFRNSNFKQLQNYNIDVSAPSGPSAPLIQYDSYVPIGASSSGNRFGGFQNNSALSSPYGSGVRPAGATPLGENYIPESTPASYSESGDLQLAPNEDPLREFGYYEKTMSFVTSEDDTRTLNPESASTPPPTSGYQENEVVTSTSEPFRINYYDPTKQPSSRLNDETMVTAGTVYPTYRNTFNDIWQDKAESTTDYASTDSEYNQQASTSHWTASPTVTRLWETTVFLDPERINQGLTTTGASGTTAAPELLVTDAAVIGRTNTDFPATGRANTDSPVTGRANTDSSPTLRWSPNDNDSPTAFTLLPSVFSTDNTATPAPGYTTHSSITTTITSSVRSSGSGRINVSAFNVTENEIVRAQEMFGGLNATSTNTLMRVMKQADSNTTVRQLVLLLISHCKGPMNKTMEEEKEQLLDALLRMPVSDFTSDESRDIIEGINKLQLPIGRSAEAPSSTADPVTTVSVTTYRSRRGRKYRPSTPVAKTLGKSADVDKAESANSLSVETGSSDNRALELLRSLYTIAAKWG